MVCAPAPSGVDVSDVSPPLESRGLELWPHVDGAGFIRSLAQDGAWDAPHARLLDYRIEEVEPGWLVLSWQVPTVLLNPAGIAHGGFLVAMLDDAAGLSAASRYPRFVPQMTVQLTTDFVAPVRPGIVHRVEGQLVRSGRSTNIADARILDPDGTLLTRSTGVFQPNRRAIPRDWWSEAGLL